MKCEIALKAGDIVCPVPASFSLSRDELTFPDGNVIRHSHKFNVTIISHFMVATKPLRADEEIRLNFNLAFYDMIKTDSSPATFYQPAVSGFRYLEEEEKQKLYFFADETVRQRAIADGFLPQGSASSIHVMRAARDHLIAVAAQEQVAQATVFETTGVLLPFPVRSTVELPGDLHLRFTGGAEFIQHSCLPNMRLEVTGQQIRGIALRPIEAGEKLTFNYLCTEWEVSKVFHCACSVYSCYGLIKGFKFLDREQQEHLLPMCTTAVQEKYRSFQRHADPSVEAISKNAAALSTLDLTGFVVAQHYIPAGTILFCPRETPRMTDSALVFDHIRLPHSCDANLVLLEGRLISTRPLVAGDRLTYNLNLLHYTMPAGFACDCGAASCTRHVDGFHSLPSATKAALWIFADPKVRADAAQEKGFEIASSSKQVAVRDAGGLGQATFATENIRAGGRVFHVQGLVIPLPTVYTVYLGEGKHLLFAGGAQCLAHSCRPNTRIVVDPINGCFDCFALEDIPAGQLISFNYLTTEWDMDEPFQCACGEANCFRKIKGYRHLSYEDQLRLWPSATKAVRALFVQSNRSAVGILATLSSELVDAQGSPKGLCVSRDAPSGTVLFETPVNPQVVHKTVVFGDLSLPHCCDPSAVLLNHRVVLCKAVAAGTPITLNINQLAYALEDGFECDCGSATCAHHIGGFADLAEAQKDELLLCTSSEVRAEAAAHGYKMKSSSPLVDVHEHPEMGQTTFATQCIPAGSRFFKVHGVVLPFPTVYTVQLEPGRHLLFAGGAQCLAHSCDPNVRVMVDTEGRCLDCLALRDILPGEVIAFNYLTTEWSMSSSFWCHCGSSRCFGRISGFKHISTESRQLLWSTTTTAIRVQVQLNAGENWGRLSSSLLSTDVAGHVIAAKELHEGQPILSAHRLEVVGGAVLVDGIRLRHGCRPTATVIEGQVVLLGTVCIGVEVTVDLACLCYQLEAPITCQCGAEDGAPHPVKGFAELPLPLQEARFLFASPAVRNAALHDGFRVPCSSTQVVVRANGKMGLATFAASNIRAGTRLLHVKGLRIPFPTMYTVMLSEKKHLLFADGAQCLAHSCNPNVQVCIDAINNTLECEATRDIAEGELIAFNYNTTEWDMTSSFHCLCGSHNCVCEVRGFKYLTRAQRQAILPQVTPVLKELAGMYSDVRIPPAMLRADAAGVLHAVRSIPVETVVLELPEVDVQPRQIGVGQYIVPHSTEANCVLVEGRIVTRYPLAPEEVLTVNMNYFVYDLTALFPRAFSEDCKGFKYMPESVKQRDLYLCEPPVRQQAMRDGWLVKSSQSALTVRPNGDMGQTAYATRDIAVGTKLFHCTGLVVPFPTMYTICVGEQRHLLFGDAAECIAHHCDPNVRVAVNEDSTFDFITIKPIHKGEMVTFNYNTTELHMNSPFTCLCGSPLCAGFIHGFKHLSAADRQRLWPITSDTVRKHFS